MNSVMTHQFSRVPQAEIQRSSFDRSHGHKTTFNGGYLIPVYIDEALPGDTFSLNMSAFARLATPLKPVMDNIFLDSFFFAVPIRTIWTNWEKFNGAQNNPGDSTSFACPQMTGPNVASGGIANGSLSDYFGLPTGPLSGGGGTTGITFDSFFHRAYNKIWNEWFRDQNLQNSAVVGTNDGPDAYTDYVLLKRGKRHDYFTSALPWPQKGSSVSLPLGTTAPVVSTGVAPLFSKMVGAADVDTALEWQAAASKVVQMHTVAANAASDLKFGTVTGLQTNLASATAATINALRQAFQLQRFYERDARGGTRYIEIIKAHFGVTSPDARLDRAEYLGGGSSPVNIHPVAQTTASPAVPTSNDSQGNLAGFGTASFSGHGFTKSFTEHCVIIGLVSVRADLSYQQGMNRMFNRRTRPDFFWPVFAHLGEQEVLNKEIYANVPDGTSSVQKDGIFAYQERYAEYRYKPSLITGQFRSNFATPLDMWHLAQNFSSLPVLNTTFIEESPPINRVIAVPAAPQFLFDSYFKLKCARPMPVYGVPGLIDHF